MPEIEQIEFVVVEVDGDSVAWFSYPRQFGSQAEAKQAAIDDATMRGPAHRVERNVHWYVDNDVVWPEEIDESEDD